MVQLTLEIARRLQTLHNIITIHQHLRLQQMFIAVLDTEAVVHDGFGRQDQDVLQQTLKKPVVSSL
jgi:thiamine kinase-like enzyme